MAERKSGRRGGKQAAIKYVAGSVIVQTLSKEDFQVGSCRASDWKKMAKRTQEAMMPLLRGGKSS